MIDWFNAAMRATSFVAAMLLLFGLARHETRADERLLLGTYELERNNGVVDGDTIRCWKLEGGVRMLGVDAEETFKELSDRREAGRDWEAYAAKKAAANDLPVKYGSFIGEEASHYARDFFRGIKSVRLEYDSPSRKKDIYGRHLCYVFATPQGAAIEQNYCVELVRQGYSPYSMKYGHSARFRKQFETAEKEAHEAKRGIWGDRPMGYRDYDKRLKWWKERATQLERFTAAHGKNESAIDLGANNAVEKLRALEGKQALLLCIVPEFKDGLHADAEQPWFSTTAAKDVDLRVSFASKELYEKCAAAGLRGWYVSVRGTVQRHEGRDWQLSVTRAEDFGKA